MATFLRTVESFVQGARTMPQRYYVGEDVFAMEQDRIFARSWLCVGRSAELAEPGAYKLQAIGADSVIMLPYQRSLIFCVTSHEMFLIQVVDLFTTRGCVKQKTRKSPL